MIPVFFGLAGPRLTASERAFFNERNPAGYIVFKRNIVDHEQLLELTDTLRDLAGRDLPILIDQEGGRVARLGPPGWPAFPPAAAFGGLYATAPVSAIEAARLNAQALGLLLRDVGITVDCLPLLDVRDPAGHGIIGDRAYAEDPMWVAALGRATLDGLHEKGVVGVIKHIPGHGRARVDSHETLPVVDASRDELERDFAPFRALSDAPMAMTAHITYTALDPVDCATLSAKVIGETIRGDIGFDGLLMSDDLGMKALGGTFRDRTRRCLAAGCDIALHCSGDFAEMVEVADAAGEIAPRAAERLAVAALLMRTPKHVDIAELTAKRDALLALA